MSRIVLITNSIGFGGAEKMLTFVANQLSERGHDCTVVNLNTVPTYVNVHKQTLNDEVHLYTLDSNIYSCIRKRINHIKQILKIVKASNAQIIIGFTGRPNMYASMVGKLLHIPSVMSERGDPERTNPPGIKSKIASAIINLCTGGVFQTKGAMNFYSKGLQKRSAVIPNPIFIKCDIPDIEYDEREKTVVSVGRLDNEQKRIDVMLKAFSIFLKSHPDYVLKLYGKGDDEDIIRQWCKELDIENSVKLMGLTTTPMQDIAKDGMFLITSDYEGISNSLLEAMAVGLSCVSTDHTPGGARLLIQDHENGLLAPIGDFEALAKAMCEFADNPDLAKKCGNNAKDVVDRFEPQKIIDMWENYISSLIVHNQ